MSTSAIGKAAASFSAGSSSAAGIGAHVDYFLKVEGMPSESQDSKHKDEIHIESFSWGLSQTGTFALGGGGGAGKVAMHDFNFVAVTNKASALLMKAGATGQHIKSAILTARKAGGEQQDYFKITMSDVLISGYQVSASSEVPMDQCSMNFAKIEVEYKPQKADGTLDSPVKFGYDLKQAKSL